MKQMVLEFEYTCSTYFQFSSLLITKEHPYLPCSKPEASSIG